MAFPKLQQLLVRQEIINLGERVITASTNKELEILRARGIYSSHMKFTNSSLILSKNLCFTWH